MASKPKESNSSQPACVTLTSIDGSQMNITIGRITNSVSVGNSHTVVTGPPQPATTVDQLTRYEQQTQTFEKETRDLPNRNIDEGTVGKISPHFSQGWRRVFRHLNVSDAEIDATFEGYGQMQETVNKLLLQWTRAAITADVRTLVEALVRAEQVHVVQFLRD